MSRIIFFLVLFSFQVVYGQQGNNRVPKVIIDTLNAHYPGWRLFDNLKLLSLPEVKADFPDTTACLPNLVLGDFNNDGRTDFALFIDRALANGRKEQRLIAFLARPTGYEEYPLREAVQPVYFAEYISLAKKGSESYDFDSKTKFTVKSDGINLVTVGKNSELLLYIDGYFVGVTTSD
jgi:hypothetical protein